MRLIVGISGASGAPYAARLLDYLKTEGETLGVETHLIFSTNGRCRKSTPNKNASPPRARNCG